jgi:hypothetical protein
VCARERAGASGRERWDLERLDEAGFAHHLKHLFRVQGLGFLPAQCHRHFQAAPLKLPHSRRMNPLRDGTRTCKGFVFQVDEFLSCQSRGAVGHALKHLPHPSVQRGFLNDSELDHFSNNSELVGWSVGWCFDRLVGVLVS